MEKHEADAIIKFLDFADKTMSDVHFTNLCIEIEKANSDVTDDQQDRVWWVACGYCDKHISERAMAYDS